LGQPSSLPGVDEGLSHSRDLRSRLHIVSHGHAPRHCDGEVARLEVVEHGIPPSGALRRTAGWMSLSPAEREQLSQQSSPMSAKTQISSRRLEPAAAELWSPVTRAPLSRAATRGRHRAAVPVVRFCIQPRTPQRERTGVQL
jgi:hypothetical protein